MDDIKVAFETIIVGVLAIPWLAVLFYGASLLFGSSAESNPFRDLAQRVRENTIAEGAGKFASVFLVAFTYFAGSGVSRLADFYTGLTDQTRFLYPLVRSDGCIRLRSYLHNYSARPMFLDARDFPDFLLPAVDSLRGVLDADRRAQEWNAARRKAHRPGADSTVSCLGRLADRWKKYAIKPLYVYQKYRIYNSSENGFVTLRHIESEIVVLRGGFLNGVILCLVCLPYLLVRLAARLAHLARYRRRPYRPAYRELAGRFRALFLLGLAIAAMGRFAWQAVEEYYDDHVIALFHTLDHPRVDRSDGSTAAGVSAGTLPVR